MFDGPSAIRLLYLLSSVLIYSCSGNTIQTRVFTDGFQDLSPTEIPMSGSVNPFIYLQNGRGVLGHWTVATSLRQEGFNNAWQIRQGDRGQILAQDFANLDSLNEPISLVTHPIIVAGDSLWSDFKIEVDFTPLAKFDKCGLVFAYQHPNDFFFFGMEGNTVILKHVLQPVTPLRPIEQILEYRPLVWAPGEEMHAVVTVRRNKISTILNDTIRMYEETDLIRPGRIGLISDLPAEFSRVELYLLRGEQRKLIRKKRQLNRKQEIHLDRHPLMVNWRVFNTLEFGTDQNIRLGDLTGDGNKEVLFIRGHPATNNICCISAMNLDGDLIWQYGERESEFRKNGEELPVQIHDLDGDGSREVVFCNEGKVLVLEGKTGKLMFSREIPGAMVPATLVFGDLLATGRDNCLLLSDRNGRLVVMNERLEKLWDKEIDGTSQPMFLDLDGDGHDEVLSGFSVLDHSGDLLFNAGTYIGDKCNGVTLTELDMEGRREPCLLYSAGDWGLLYVNYEGHLLKQNILGHVKYMTVADLDAESPGLELVTSNGWGSDGLIHVLDASGKVSGDLIPASGVSRCIPVNWKGDGEEFFIISADSISGGMFDKDGLLSVKFPSDGHPVQCHMTLDLTGDARDEVLVWDERSLWIYTQDDNPRMGHTYNPDRIPPYNHSMHQMNHSLPAW